MTSGPAHPDITAPHTTDLADLIAELSVQDKVLLLTGADAWRTQGADALGLRPMVCSDGPAGVRGILLDERHPSSSLPCPSALGGTWDTGLVRELAAALGAEARSKDVDVLLAPTINLMRTPLGGRGFEFFSEDPVLTARMAVAFITGLQSAGVAAVAKHFVGNDSETERWGYDAVITETVLRELYLAPFEAAVREAGTALVMAAYNKVNGTPATAHAWLLRKVLKGEWEFDGVVVSDWNAARATVPTAVAGLDLAMPGPHGPWGEDLARAVLDGAVPESDIDDKLARILRLARRVGALAAPDGNPDPVPAPRPGQDPGTAVDGAPARGLRPSGNGGPAGGRAGLADADLVRRAAAASFVLLRNEGPVLPFDAGTVGSIALIGPNAVHPVIQGGGSAVVAPAAVSTPALSLPAALDGRATVTVAPGCRTWTTVP